MTFDEFVATNREVADLRRELPHFDEGNQPAYECPGSDFYTAYVRIRFAEFQTRGGETGIRFSIDNISSSVASVPEADVWALIIGGFGFIGGAMRRKRRAGQVTATS